MHPMTDLSKQTRPDVSAILLRNSSFVFATVIAVSLTLFIAFIDKRISDVMWSALLSGGSLFALIVKVCRARTLFRDGVFIQGSIVKKYHGGKTGWNINYSYTYSGNTYAVNEIGISRPERFEVGKTITVVIDPNNPLRKDLADLYL
jgi:hypothetical protein